MRRLELSAGSDTGVKPTDYVSYFAPMWDQPGLCFVIVRARESCKITRAKPQRIPILLILFMSIPHLAFILPD